MSLSNKITDRKPEKSKILKRLHRKKVIRNFNLATKLKISQLVGCHFAVRSNSLQNNCSTIDSHD